MRLPLSTVPAVAAPLVLSLALTLIATPALAVYKCEANGSTLYSDAPCPGGSKLDTAVVTAADAAEAKARAARQKALAVRLDQERAKEEAAREKRAAAQMKTAAREAQKKKAQCDTLAQRAKWAEEDARTAAGPGAARSVTKARRAAEQYDTRCRS